MRIRWPLAVLIAVLVTSALPGAELILPQERQAYYSSEPIELAVAGLAQGTSATIEIIPTKPGPVPVRLEVKGAGSTATLALPPGALAPGVYTLKLDGKGTTRLSIASGVRQSSALVSQTVRQEDLVRGGADLVVTNAGGFGRLQDGAPATAKLRATRSGGMKSMERPIEMDLPQLIYHYWTGYTTHKPFGSNKSWASAEEQYAMRLLSFHTAQRLRRFPGILAVGTIDEPGLSWGPTPTGRMASGFANWDEQPWYESRGWRFTNDPASRPDDDWMKYMSIRCSILGESFTQAKKDLKAAWPEVVFSTDAYALHAIMDGTDVMNQRPNDIPCSHVFTDWGIDRLGVYSGIALEKAHDPGALVAHAMNGQLHSKRVPQPNMLYSYRVAMNGMLAAGLESNWWLNTGGMTAEELAAVNEPVRRYGPMLREMSMRDGPISADPRAPIRGAAEPAARNRRKTAAHDVAVLWSFTEMSMRQKEHARKEAATRPGEKITLKVTDLPENSAIKEKELSINAYSIGQEYKESVLTVHYALARAGYPARIVDERVLSKFLNDFQVLVIVSQTRALAADVLKAIEDFTAAGGQVVTDRSTTIPLKGAIVADLSVKGLNWRWEALFTQDAATFKTPREASFFKTTHFMDTPVRQAVAPIKMAMRKTRARAWGETDSDDLLFEHFGSAEGESVLLVINGREELPQIPEDQSYPIYNYAPQRARFSLAIPPRAGCVYAIEGADWSKVTKLADPSAGIDGQFEPGEMKMYVVLPTEPRAVQLSATLAEGRLSLAASLERCAASLPFRLTIKSPAGASLYDIHRATGADGQWHEEFPLGLNALPGVYTIQWSSPVSSLSAEARVEIKPGEIKPRSIDQPVRVFDEAAIRRFLGSKPQVVIALGNESHRAVAGKLAEALGARGVKATIMPESQALRKVRYPRVWNPFVSVYRASGDEQPIGDRKVLRRIDLSIDPDGAIRVKSDDGKDWAANWKQPNSLVTIGGDGFLDWSGDNEIAYEAGVKLYVDERRRVTVLNGTSTDEKATEALKAKWGRPWSKLGTHYGGFQLPAELPEAYTTDHHLILLGDSTTSSAVAALQASDLLLQVVDPAYPGPGKSLVSFAWSPFAVEKNAILIGASDEPGLAAGVETLIKLTGR